MNRFPNDEHVAELHNRALNLDGHDLGDIYDILCTTCQATRAVKCSTLAGIAAYLADMEHEGRPVKRFVPCPLTRSFRHRLT